MIYLVIKKYVKIQILETHFKCLEKFSYSFKKKKKYKHFGTQMSSRAVSLSTKKKIFMLVTDITVCYARNN